MNFDALTRTWERLAAEINAEFVIEEGELDYIMDLHRFPFGKLIFKDLSPMETWTRFKWKRPRINVVYKHWQIALRSTYPPSRSNKDRFLVTVQANFTPRKPLHIRVVERSAARFWLDWLRETELGIAAKEYFKSLTTRMPGWMLFRGEPVIGSRSVRSGLPEFDSSFSIEASDEKVADRVLAALLPEPLLSIKDSFRTLVFRSMADSTPTCVFLYGFVSAKSIYQSRQLLTFMQITLDSLLSLGLIDEGAKSGKGLD